MTNAQTAVVVEVESEVIQPERSRFDMLKKVVSDGLAICFIVGSALREIKEKEYFKLDGFKTYEEFCDSEWGWSKRYCNQLILDAKTINSLPESMRLLIRSERAARELGQIPEALRPAVVEAATNGGKKPATAAAVKAAAPKSSGPPPRAAAKPSAGKSGPPPRKAPATTKKAEPKLPKDATGVEVPKEILPLWERGIEAQELMTYTSAIRAKLKKVQDAKDPLFSTIDFTDTQAQLNQVFENLKEAKPYAVCPTCGGKTPKDCIPCKGRGFVSEFFWNNCVPSEVKALRCSTPKK